jgi:hypothetical protein
MWVMLRESASVSLNSRLSSSNLLNCLDPESHRSPTIRIPFECSSSAFAWEMLYTPVLNCEFYQSGRDVVSTSQSGLPSRSCLHILLQAR